MDEGLGRLSRKEFIRFLDISRGCSRETLGRYKRLHHWLTAGTISERIELTDRIIARLTKAITTLRADNPAPEKSSGNCVHEASAPYTAISELNPDETTEEDITTLLQL
jgi:hypothetical protein